MLREFHVSGVAARTDSVTDEIATLPGRPFRFSAVRKRINTDCVDAFHRAAARLTIPVARETIFFIFDSCYFRLVSCQYGRKLTP
jgi:hypothetical protein